ncbi:hypothetical protein H8S23_12925 [Anaerofilum sp. BX8]|uniref:Uncharacterized protein n=1 Tax=Anaerofilum hominis TaxID=2763016 RepID=A0A923RFC8_9FIRM|nr:hypothetical protein [Anaerofilum hominis]MBC5582409.1 hypothetical protein [Anaerofilum hominis]
MGKREKFNDFVADAGKNAKNLLNKVVQVADQTDDGKFDLADVAVIAEGVGNAVKKGAQEIKARTDEKSWQLELKSLQPIFPTQVEGAVSLDDADFLMPKFIRIVERDKKRMESPVCQGSIGYVSDSKGLHIVNIFRDSVEPFGLTFYPDCDSEFYYMDPSDRDSYISLDEYFSYLKIARVNELKKIAQNLGAKHFKVTYKEKCISFTEKKVKAKGKAAIATLEREHKSRQEQYTAIDVVAEMTFPGHAPVKPQLKYLQRDKNIQTLIAMRMDEKSPLLKEHFELEMCNSSGMKLDDAVKIDAVLKGLKYSGNADVASEVKNEARRYLEYDIEF